MSISAFQKIMEHTSMVAVTNKQTNILFKVLGSQS